MGSGGPGGKGGVRKNEFMTLKSGKIGPEIGIGHHMGNLYDGPVLILKSCIGNRSLGWDLLPPGSPSYEFEDKDKKSKQMKLLSTQAMPKPRALDQSDRTQNHQMASRAAIRRRYRKG